MRHNFVLKGELRSGRMKCMKANRTNRLVAAIAALVLLPGVLNAMNHIYKGHYTSGSAAWTVYSVAVGQAIK